MDLINSIPDEWQDCLKAGNQTHTEGEFFATIMQNDGTIGDVYRYQAGFLEHFALGPTGILTYQQDRARPGTRIRNNINWPRLTELKRLRVVTDTSSDTPTFTVISFLLQSRGNLDVYEANVFSHTYTHPSITCTLWTALAKEWRESLHVRHRHTESFALATFGDPQYNLYKLTTQLNAIVTEPKRIETLWKIMNNSLYIGEIGRNYQLNIKNIPPNDPRALAGHCIYSGHAFDPQYRAIHRTTDPLLIPATYAHILWTGHTANLVWKEADFLAQAMNLPPVTNNFNSYQDTLRFIESADLTEEATIITVNLILEVIWTLYTSEKELNELYKNGSSTIPDKQIDLWPRTCVTTFRFHATKLALSHRHTMKIILSKSMPIRNKMLRDTKHYTQLTNNEITMYSETWTKTDLVQITNGALVVNPFRREPP
jgi:hypothetical protein